MNAHVALAPGRRFESGMEGFPRSNSRVSPVAYEPLSGTEFAAELERFGFTQARFASFIGLAPRTVRGYVANGAPNYIVAYLDLLKRTRFEDAPDPISTTQELTNEVCRPIFRGLADDAVKAYWPKKMVAQMLRDLADELATEAEAEPEEAIPLLL